MNYIVIWIEVDETHQTIWISRWSKVKVKVKEPLNTLLFLDFVYQTPAKMTSRPDGANFYGFADWRSDRGPNPESFRTKWWWWRGPDWRWNGRPWTAEANPYQGIWSSPNPPSVRFGLRLYWTGRFVEQSKWHTIEKNRHFPGSEVDYWLLELLGVWPWDRT